MYLMDYELPQELFSCTVSLSIAKYPHNLISNNYKKYCVSGINLNSIAPSDNHSRLQFQLARLADTQVWAVVQMHQEVCPTHAGNDVQG